MADSGAAANVSENRSGFDPHTVANVLFFSGFGAAVGSASVASSVTGWEPAKRTFVVAGLAAADYSGICDWRRKRLGLGLLLFFQQMLGQGIAGILRN